MTTKEQRDAVIAKAKSRERKNQYTQGSKRTQVGTGWSDCSSFVRWCYLQVLGQDIGLNTAAQIVNDNLQVVDQSGAYAPDEKKLLPGDLLFFKGADRSRPYQVGHVELYIGSNKIIGHGSGKGPTIKAMSSYCKSRASQGKGYIRTLRVIRENDAQRIIPADPTNSPSDRKTGNKGDVRITGAMVNIRTGPSTNYDVVRIAKAGDIFSRIDTMGWRPIQHDGAVCWVSEMMSEEIN